MTTRNFFPVILSIASLLCANCSNEAPASKAPTQSPDTTAVSPAPAPELQAQPDTAANSSETVAENPTTGSDAKPKQKAAKPNSPFKPSTTVAAKKDNPAGNPTGYIGRENIVLFSEPATTSQQLSTLKINESVIILETKMTDNAGKSFPIPQWYKVQLSNKKVGWVIGRSVTIN